MAKNLGVGLIIIVVGIFSFIHINTINGLRIGCVEDNVLRTETNDVAFVVDSFLRESANSRKASATQDFKDNEDKAAIINLEAADRYVEVLAPRLNRVAELECDKIYRYFIFNSSSP